MSTKPDQDNVRQTVPLLSVTNMRTSLEYYVDGLGFHVTDQWIDEGVLRWCWLEHGHAAIMLQESKPGESKTGPRGVGVSIYFICKDAVALYREFVRCGISVQRPFVGNHMWVTSLTDPDGYDLHFESPTDAPEGTEYAD